MANLYLLDTNILVHAVRSDPLWHAVRTRYSLMLIDPTPKISVVAEGELRSLAIQFNWQSASMSQMRFLLNYFSRADINDRDVFEAYALIDAHTQRIGQRMGKNDVWIAATARATGATLLTTDQDFDRISPVFVNRIWIDSTTI